MAFDQSHVTGVRCYRHGAELVVAWTSSDPAGTTFQVYVGRRLAWAGTRRTAHFPWPADLVTVHVGAVGAGESKSDFSGSLPADPLDRVTLTWLGGTFLGPDIRGFRVYQSATAGGPVDFAAAVADIAAYPNGNVTDGYGVGGYGQGGYGSAAGSYSWESARLGSGVWRFAVAAYDSAGNEDPSPPTTAVTVAVPPRPPAAASDGTRLSYTYSNSTHKATLTWLASPG